MDEMVEAMAKNPGGGIPTDFEYFTITATG